MSCMAVTATEIKNSFGKYLRYVMEGNEVIITKNGAEVARIIPRQEKITFLSELLRGVLHDEDEDEARREALGNKYEIDA